MNLVMAKQGLRLGALAAVLGLGVTLWPALRVLRAPVEGDGDAEAVRVLWRTEAEALPGVDVFARAGTEDLERRIGTLRLSGTIQVQSGGGGGVAYLALVDDGESGRQHLVSAGDRLGPFRVMGIGREYLALGHEDRVWELEMTGTTRAWADGDRRERRAGEEAPMTWETMPALETTPFGKRVADNQWVIQREAVFAYTRSLIEQPQRAIALYSNFSKAPPSEEGGFEGFRLTMRAEQEFLGAMGLEDGMVIRAVNSMEMSNQGRAEYMVREFMRGQMGAVVLDVEQEGEMKKLIYVIR